ncbi:MAG: ankyrin repeat domain-containing protein [Planctomycetota bacterium]
MLKKDIQSLFRAIRKHDSDVVTRMLRDQPELVRATAVSPPKKDDGQSPLQVAFKTGNLSAASLLLDLGADVGFQEQSTVNSWTAPVLHDAIRAASFSDDAVGAARLVERVLALGADPNCVDSYGNSALHRALMDARILTSGLPDFPCVISRQDVRLRLEHLFGILRRAGADPDRGTPTRESPRQSFAGEVALAALLDA